MEATQTIDRHVIVVDDEPLFLKFASIPFRSGLCGFCTWHLHTFTDTAEALGFYSLKGEGIDLLLTDFHMPAMNGIELIHAMREIRGGSGEVLPAVILSSEPPAHHLLPGRTAVVSKPFVKSDIVSALCDVSVMCQTGKCEHAAGKPKPPASVLRPRLAGERVDVWQ